jgi:hypothetical protein
VEEGRAEKGSNPSCGQPGTDFWIRSRKEKKRTITLRVILEERFFQNKEEESK